MPRCTGFPPGVSTLRNLVTPGSASNPLQVMPSFLLCSLEGLEVLQACLLLNLMALLITLLAGLVT